MFKKRSIALFIANIVTIIYFWQMLVVVKDVAALDFMGTKATIAETAAEVLASIETAAPALNTATIVLSGVAMLVGIVSFWIRNYWGAVVSAVSFVASVVTFSMSVNFVYPIGLVGWIVLGLLFTIYGFAQQLQIAKPKKK